MTQLHFGAGALGRGLVLPRIVAAGGTVAVADTDRDLIDRLRKDGGYRLTVGGQAMDIPIVAAYAIGTDDDGLDRAIAATSVITTSVQIANVSRVVRRLASVWRGADPSQRRMVIGCENLRNVGAHFTTLFEQENMSSVRCPNCVVDRICATDKHRLAVEAEHYSEWVIEGDAAPPGPNAVENVERLFFRKRYLVNALADACAFIGQSRGMSYLHEAVSDPAIREATAPLIDLMCDHLAMEFGFTAADLGAYLGTSVARLSDPAISRRIETVARDPWRKFAPDERFLEPVLAEVAHGSDIGPALASLTAIVRAVEPDAEIRRALLAEIWVDTAAASLLEAAA